MPVTFDYKFNVENNVLWGVENVVKTATTKHLKVEGFAANQRHVFVVNH